MPSLPSGLDDAQGNPVQSEASEHQYVARQNPDSNGSSHGSRATFGHQCWQSLVHQ